MIYSSAITANGVQKRILMAFSRKAGAVERGGRRGGMKTIIGGARSV